MSIGENLSSEIQKLAPSAIVELFELDLTELGGDTFLFHAGTNELKQNIVWNGSTYVRFPVQITGFEVTGQGQFPRPAMSISNILSAITAINLEFKDMLGAKVTRRRTMVRFLDAVNFASGINPDADPTAEFSPDVYFIDRKASEDRNMVHYELASSCDLAGVKLPRRQFVQNICPWIYRGEGCGYSGAVVADANDNVLDRSLFTSTEAKAYFTAADAQAVAKAALDAAQADLDTKSKSMDAACTVHLLETRGDLTTNYVTTNKATGVVLGAFWGGVAVTLGSTYRIGSVTSDTGFNILFHAIEHWGFDSTDCTNKTTTYNAAVTAKNTAQTNYDTATAAVDAAFAAIPPTDEFFGKDQCGKRLTSCKVRFGETSELPFGGFPGINMAR